MGWNTWLTVGALVLVGACGDGQDAAPTTTAPPTTVATTAPPPTTVAPTTTVVDEEAAVIAAYLGSWGAYFTVTNPGQPDHPIIDRYTTGAQRQMLVQRAQERLEANEATRVPETTVMAHDVEILSISTQSAVVRDCFVDDSHRVHLRSGAISNRGIATKLLAVRLVRVEGHWLVSESTELARTEGISGCAAG